MVLNSKCVLRAKEIEFVGFAIGMSGTRPTLENMETIERLPEPTDVSQVKSVLGTVSFYMRCVPDFRAANAIEEPMRRLLKADPKLLWGKEQKEAFYKLKNEIVGVRPLMAFDSGREIIVATDASNVGCGAFLLQVWPDGERPVAFASCALHEAQKRYSAGEKGALACVFAIEKWHVFLYRRKFRLRTDHQALVALLGKTGTGRAPMRIARRVDCESITSRWNIVRRESKAVFSSTSILTRSVSLILLNIKDEEHRQRRNFGGSLAKYFDRAEPVIYLFSRTLMVSRTRHVQPKIRDSPPPELS